MCKPEDGVQSAYYARNACGSGCVRATFRTESHAGFTKESAASSSLLEQSISSGRARNLTLQGVLFSIIQSVALVLTKASKVVDDATGSELAPVSIDLLGLNSTTAFISAKSFCSCLLRIS